MNLSMRLRALPFSQINISNSYFSYIFKKNAGQFFFILFFTVLSQAARSNTGDLDPTFGTGGLIMDVSKTFSGIVKQPDGKLLVRGSSVNGQGSTIYFITRYNLDGSIDNTFSTGDAHTNLASNLQALTFLTVDANGKMLAVLNSMVNNKPAIVRYNPDGSLDNSFNGSGRLTDTLFGGSVFDYKIYIQNDGKIIVYSSTEIIRINYNGTIDRSLGTTGKLISSSSGSLASLAVQNDGKIITVGTLQNSLFGVINRYNVDGTRDLTFAKNGEALTNYGTFTPVEYYYYHNASNSVMIQADGKIITGGTSTILKNNLIYGGIGLARYNTNGTLDSTFDSDGVATTDFGFIRGINGSYSFSLDANGKIVVAGGSSPYPDYQIARFNTDGSPDITFSDDGVLSLDLSRKQVSVGAVVSGSSVYIAGNSTNVGAILAAFTLDDKVISGLSYRYYTGNWNMLPDFSSLNPDKTGLTSNVDISNRPAGITDHFAFVWEGYINIQTPGTYTFETVSDDGSKFYFNNFYSPSTTALVTNDGVHAAQSATGTVTISSAGLYPVAITYFEKDGGESMQLYWTAPGKAREMIPASLFTPRTIAPDLTLPEPPTNLRLGITGRTFARVDWNKSISPGIAGYEVYNKSYFIKFTTDTFAVVDGLDLNGKITLRSRDSAGVRSNPSKEVVFQTVSKGLYYELYTNITQGVTSVKGLNYIQSGNTSNVDISIRPKDVNENYEFTWQGYINIPAPGKYTFETISDDGSKLYFGKSYSEDAIPTIDNFENNGLHAPVSVSSTIDVPSAGLYPFSVRYNQYGGGQTLQLFWKGPGFDRQPIPDAAFTDDTKPGSLYNGINYKYYEGNWTTLPDFTILTPVKTGVSSNIDLSVRTTGRDDNFAFVWNGYVIIPAAGVYTFETISDDGSRLSFNSNVIVNNDGVHPATSAKGSVYVGAGGYYPISISFFENTGQEKMEVYWSGPNFSRQLIPGSSLSPSLPPTILTRLGYRYYSGGWTSLPDYSALTPKSTGNSSNVDITNRPDGANDVFAFIWQGYINIPTDGNYTFETISDDGSKLYFNGFYNPATDALVNNDGIHPAASVKQTMYVNRPGIYPIAITYFNLYGAKSMEVYWSGPGIPRQRIPDEAFVLVNPAVIPSSFSTAATQQSTEVNAATLSEERVGLRSVYPNPFNESVTIDFYNSTNTSNISIGLYDLNGRQVLLNRVGRLPAGDNLIKMNLANLNIKDGMYVVQIQKNGLVWKTMKVMKMKK